MPVTWYLVHGKSVSVASDISSARGCSYGCIRYPCPSPTDYIGRTCRSGGDIDGTDRIYGHQQVNERHLYHHTKRKEGLVHS